MILGAGCTDTGGANPETTTYTPPPQESLVVEETAAAEPIHELVETPWYVGRVGFEDAQVGTYSTLFDSDVDAVKTSMSGGSYDLFDTQTQKHILTHQEWTPSIIALHNELSPDQYKALVSEYGSMRHLTMETIDLDQDGAMDKVAVKYVGSDGVLEFEMDVIKNRNGRILNLGVAAYISRYYPYSDNHN